MIIQENNVFVKKVNNYNVERIYKCLNDNIFKIISSNDKKVILKPNWVKESHLYKTKDWEYIITHPDVITAVIKKVLNFLKPEGEIYILDGPQTDSSFKKIISYYPIEDWQTMASHKGIELKILDLRDEEWVTEDGIIIHRTKLRGDPKGKVEVNIKRYSEFYGHKNKKKVYYGADYNIKETNKAHDGYNNIYRVSKTVIEGDVFINIPKLKTHKKAGITCCLKNLVGINTYKNYLPHYTIGSPLENGDQFPESNINTKIESHIISFLKQNLLRFPLIAKYIKPLKKLGEKFLGNTDEVIRSGNWYGNDTIWRMILDLNKVLFYANSDGSLRIENYKNKKKYIGIVDAILCGEGNGPMAPDPVKLGYIIYGINPVSIDAVCAKLMGFNPLKIPSILKAFLISNYKICDFYYNDIIVNIDEEEFNINDIPTKFIKKFKPPLGWIGHIEE